MKKKLLLVLLILLSVFMVACQSDQADLSKQVAELESELEAVKKEKDQAIQDKNIAESKLKAIEEQKELKEEEVVVKVIDKSNVPKDTDKWIFSDYVAFEIGITNNSDKDIKGIQGEIDIKDMFDVSFLTISCDLTGDTIVAGETSINNEMSLEINEFMNPHNKLYVSEYDDLIFEYKISKILFTDGTIKE